MHQAGIFQVKVSDAKKDRAKAVQSKIKALEKLERVQVLSHRKTVRFKFPDVERSGKESLRKAALATIQEQLTTLAGEPIVSDLYFTAYYVK